MTALINLIGDHAGKLNILPIIVVMTVIITVLIHFLNRKRFTKYIPALVLGFGGLFLLIYAFRIFTSPRGLDLTWVAVFLGAAGLVGLFTSFIIDLLTSIIRTSKNIENPNKNVKLAKKSKTASKTKNAPKAKKTRVAQKPNKGKKEKTASKYQTTKIKAVDEPIRASKKKRQLTEKISFEAGDDKE